MIKKKTKEELLKAMKEATVEDKKLAVTIVGKNFVEQQLMLKKYWTEIVPKFIVVEKYND